LIFPVSRFHKNPGKRETLAVTLCLFQIPI